ncbi:M56 family metallopeptidase [Gemmiger sp.]
MFLPVFIAFFVQGLLLGLAALALLAAAPKLQKRYGPRWLCRLWVTLAVLFLVPLRVLLPQAPAAVTLGAEPFYTQMNALTEETTAKPAAGVPYRTTTAADNTTHYIVPRAELQTGDRTILERLAVDTNWGNLAALAWELGLVGMALYQFGGYAVWRIRVRRTVQPVAQSWRDALPQGQCPHMQATPLVRSPMVAGTLCPVLLVPAGEAPKGADCMLAHELTHIKRHDVAKKLLFTLVCVLHWYNPAVWMLSARAARDIEEACDAETLHGRDAAYRAAYADALMTAVRQNRGPALTSGFALNKRQFKQRLAALWDTAPKHRGRALLAVLALAACCAGSLVACQTADTPAQDTPEPAPTAAPSTEEARAEIEKINRQLPDEQQLNAIRRVDSYFCDEYLPSVWGYKFNGGMTSLIDDPAADEALSDILQEPRADGTTWQNFLADGDGALAKVEFEAELEPEGLFLGSQYGEGNFYIYIAVPYDESEPCELVSRWLSTNTGEAAHFGTIDPARELRLTNRQYRTLVHQCNALAQAGARDFGTPADWPQAELETYLYYRNRDFHTLADALLMLNIDFTGDRDWNSLPYFLTYDELNALDFTAPKTDAIPDYVAAEGDDSGVWVFTRDGDYLTATWAGVQEYRFYVYNGDTSALQYDARTVITGGHSLS